MNALRHTTSILVLLAGCGLAVQASEPAVTATTEATATTTAPTPTPAAAPAPETAVKPEVPAALKRGKTPPAPTPPEIIELQSKLSSERDVTRLLATAAAFDARGEYLEATVALERVLQLRPMAGNIQYELAATYAQLDNKQRTYDLLLKLQTTGYAYDPALDERFKKVHGTQVWEYIVLNLQANAKPFGEGKVAMSLPAEDILIESLAYDEKAGQLLAGSARDGAVYRVSADGSELIHYIEADGANQLRSIVAMQADNERGHLWLTATGLPHFKTIKDTDYGKTALYQFELASGKFLKRYDMPTANGPHLLDHIHVNRQGRVFAGDSAQRRIYQLDGENLKLVMQNPNLTHVRGITSSDDGRMLYFADTELGIFGIDLQLGKPFAVVGPATLTLFGIDGMYYWKGHLIVVQNAFPPARIMRLKLDPAGVKIVASLPLDAGHPELEAPTRGVIHHDKLYLIANSQRPHYDRYGLPDKTRLEGVDIWQSDLKFALDSVQNRTTEIPVTPAKR
jgi:sugar lactone lactonase YvrE